MLTVADILGGAFRLVRERIGAIAIWALACFAMNIAVFFAMRPFVANMTALQTAQAAGAAPDPAAMLGAVAPIFGVSLVLMVGILVLYTAALRAAVWPQERAFAYLRLGMDELRMLGLAVILGIAFMILYIALVIVASIVGAAVGVMAHGAIIPVVIGLIFVVVATLVFFQTRFSLAFALTMLRRRIVIGESWRLTRGRFWTLFGAYFVLLLIVFASAMILFAMSTGPYLAQIGRASTDPVALRAVQQQQLAHQYGAVTVLSVAGWALGAVLGAFWIAIVAGAAGTAMAGLRDGSFAEVAAIYE